MLLIMNEKRRYKTTKVRDKQPIIRALNTFSKQYKYIYAKKIEVDLNCEHLELNYSDEEFNSEYKIYSDRDSKKYLRKYDHICKAIDSLFEIGPTEWKDSLKKEISEYKTGEINFFLSDSFENSARYIISKHSSNKKIYNYIKNYVKYSHSGIYQLNKSKKLKIKPIDTLESFHKRLEFLQVAKELYQNTLQEIEGEYKQLENTLEEWRKNPNYDPDALREDNDSYFHPIDDSEQSDTIWMIEKKKSGLYDEDTLQQLHQWQQNILDKKEQLKKKLKPLEYAFDIRFDFETMKDFNHFYIEEFRDSLIFEIAAEFKEELEYLLEKTGEYADIRQSFVDLYIHYQGEYSYNEWAKNQIRDLEKCLFHSKYKHKLREVTKDIKKGLLSDELKNSFDQLYDLGLRLLDFGEDKVDDIKNMIRELNIILEQKEIDYEYLAENYEKILQEKDDYQISDMDWLIENGYIEDEVDWRDIQWYIEKKESERNAEHNRIRF